MFAGFDAEVWFGLLGPASMPPEVARRLEQEVLAVMADKSVQKDFTDRLISVQVLNATQFEQQIANDLKSWKQLASQLNIKLD